jgi:hypothetical protein
MKGFYKAMALVSLFGLWISNLFCVESYPFAVESSDSSPSNPAESLENSDYVSPPLGIDDENNFSNFRKIRFVYPNPKKLRIQTSWVSRDLQQFKSAFFGGPVYISL